MKIAVTSKGEKSDSLVDERFGRCDIFQIFNMDLETVQAIYNTGAQSMEGAGIKAASILSDAGVKILITGNIGPNAFRSLDAAGIEVYTGASGTVEEALSDYSKGELERTKSPTAAGHHQ
jgi:predicted Fe-Mo cluster-binding NifX family protein